MTSKLKFSLYGVFFLLIFFLSSAFGFRGDLAQQADSTPTNTATLPGGGDSAENTQDDAQEPTPTPVPDDSQFEAYLLPTPTPLPEIKEYAETASFTFRDVGEETIILHYLDIYEMEVDLPNQWNLYYPNSYLEIHYDLFEEEIETQAIFADGKDGDARPPVEVYINDRLAGTFYPEVGKDQIARINFPHLLVEDRPFNVFNSYTIEFQYIIDYDDWCDYEGVITIHEDSTINLVFDDVSAHRSLADFPRPLVQDSFLPETLHFILPDDYSETDLAALSKTASAIGRGTFSNLKFNVMTASEVTSQVLADSNAVIIGKPSDNTFLSNLYADGVMPTSLSFDDSAISGLPNDNDGLLQLIAATDDMKHSFLIISGNSDEGLLTAAQALSNPPIGMAGSWFIVSEDQVSVSETSETEEEAFTKLFSELGLVGDRIKYGIGRSQTVVSFYTPRDWKVQDGAMLVLNYAYSKNISYNNSALNVYLNEVPIAAAIIDEDAGEKQLSVPLEEENIIIGARNTIRIETSIGKAIDCALYDPRSSWMVIRDTSILHIPYVTVTDPQDLSPIVHPMDYLVTEQDVLFSLPIEPTKDELDTITHIAYLLGQRLRSDQEGFNFSVNLDPKFDPNLYEDANMVFVGKPSENASVVTINDSLPQPFLPGEDTLTPKQSAGTYRIQGDVSIGMIQALPAPWNPFRAVTVLTGTTDDGVNWAMDSATNDDVYFAMDGDIIFVRENVLEAFRSSFPIYASLDTIISGMTDENVVLEEAPETGEEAENETQQDVVTDRYVQETSSQRDNPMNLYVVSSVILLGVFVAAMGIVRTVRGGRRR